MSRISGLGDAAQSFIAKPRKLLINGQWVEAASGKTFDAINPASESVVAAVAEGGAEDVNRAVAAARKAFEDSDWSRMTPADRERLLLKLADLVEANADELSQLESL